RSQYDRGLGEPLTVQVDELGEIELGQHVSIEHHQRVGDALARIAYAAGGAERARLHHVADLDAGLASVAEDVFDALGLVIEAQNHLVDFRHALDEVELIIQKRTVEDRYDRFGRVDGERTQARTLASDQQ